MIPLQRQELILSLVREKGTVPLTEIIEALPVSHMTVRRDIKKLEESGRLVSVQGGITLPVRVELDLAHRVKRELRSEVKALIAESAVRRVVGGERVFLDAGTTSLAIAHALLAEDLAATYLTNDLEVARLLADHTERQIYFLGGQIDAANLSTEGYGTADALRRHNIDIAFISTSSFDLRGISVPSEEKLMVKEAIIQASSTSILVTDSTKYGKVAQYRAIPLTKFAEIHTDDELNPAAATAISDMGVKLVLNTPRGVSPQ